MLTRSILRSLLLSFVVVACSVSPLLFVAHAADTGGGTGSTNTGGGTGSVDTGGGVGTSNTSGSGVTLQNPLQNINDLPTLISTILKAIVQLGSVLLTVMLVWVGFQFVMARGNPEEISKARGALIWTLIGGLILLGAEAISQVIQSTVQSL